MTLYNELLQIIFYLVTLGGGGEVIEKLVNQILYFFFYWCHRGWAYLVFLQRQL